MEQTPITNIAVRIRSLAGMDGTALGTPLQLRPAASTPLLKSQRLRSAAHQESTNQQSISEVKTLEKVFVCASSAQRTRRRV